MQVVQYPKLILLPSGAHKLQKHKTRVEEILKTDEFVKLVENVKFKDQNGNNGHIFMKT